MDVEAFIVRWTDREGGAERANYQMFLIDLCDVVGVPRPDVAGGSHEHNDYVFERAVRPRDSADTSAPKRIDLYKRGCFILEAKQSRLPGKKNAIPGQTALALGEPERLGRRDAAKGWDVMMQNARRQGENYVFLLDTDHAAPPFLIVCDVGHVIELYADFTGTGRAYGQFPDRKGYRIYLDDLRDPAIRERLRRVWTEPLSLDPTRHAARVTREIARRLAEVSKRLEQRGCNAEDVAHFLMRCLFTMFAEDVELLPKDSFKTLLRESIDDPAHFAFRLKALWTQMDEGEDFSFVIRARVRRFNGGLFKATTAFDLDREEIGELLAAADRDWTEVDPAIFGTLLEQALDKTERRKLGAHYTPRAYVQRLVDVTVMEPLRADWQAALTRAEQAQEDGDEKRAVALVRGFLQKLCATRVLDPACGTGNFLYVALELMKRLEGEVLETLAKLGEPESMGLDRESVDPHQFLGLELNPRAAAIAELVVWIGFLQQHYRTRTGHPSEPILRAFENINFGRRSGYDAVLTWDGYPLPKLVERDGKWVETYPNARRPEWPEAEFIVGNPPFIGNKRMIDRLGAQYVDAVRNSWPDVPKTADFVMLWWEAAAILLSRNHVRRFGLVTTNSISMVYNRSIVEKWLKHKKSPLSLEYVIPDHPWMVGNENAAVRISMTVVVKGISTGYLQRVVNRRPGLTYSDTLSPPQNGVINSMLEIGTRLDDAKPLLQNLDLSFMGIIPVSLNFIISEQMIDTFGYSIENLPKTIRQYLGGRALTNNKKAKHIIDFFGLTSIEARNNYPKLYQYVLENVKPFRDKVNRANHRLNWWIFGEARPGMRRSLRDLQEFIATTETSRHRWFTFLSTSILPDQKIRIIASSDRYMLAILSSKIHVFWATAIGGRVGVGNDPVYNNTTCFDPFPFPAASDVLKTQLRAAGEDLDAHRKRVQAEHPDLTLTGLYNVLEKLKAGTALSEKDEDVKRRGLVRILKELHETIDRLTFEAYGWPQDLSDDQILARLVALNAERAREEAGGLVRWLRPDYQIPRFGKGVAAKTGELDLAAVAAPAEVSLPAFPTDPLEAPLAIEALLAASGRAMSAGDVARGFKRGGKRIEPRVLKALTTLVRYGRVTILDGDRYATQKAA